MFAWIVKWAPIGILILLFLPEGKLQECPETCDCLIIRHKYTVDCNSKGLNVIPDGINKKASILDFSYNNISRLEKSSVIYLSQAIKLDLSHNAIRYIQEGTFNNIKKLEMLDLSYNELSYLSSNLFESNSKLTALYLKSNSFRLPIVEPFLMSRSLDTLNLAYCGITYMPTSTFIGLRTLKHLYLDGNCFGVLSKSVVSPLSALKVLYINNMNESDDWRLTNEYLKSRNVTVEMFYDSPCDELTTFDVNPFPIHPLVVMNKTDIILTEIPLHYADASKIEDPTLCHSSKKQKYNTQILILEVITGFTLCTVVFFLAVCAAIRIKRFLNLADTKPQYICEESRYETLNNDYHKYPLYMKQSKIYPI